MTRLAKSHEKQAANGAAISKSVMRGRFAAMGAAILLAGLLAGCTGARVDQEASASRSVVTPVREPVAVQSVKPTALPAATKSSGASAGEGSGASLPAEARTSDGGGVVVQVTPEVTVGDRLVFDVSLNTHSVDLSYDYRALASLRDDQGHTYPAASWDGGSGGHHQTGKLVFTNTPAVIGPGIKWMELEIKDVAGVPLRTFRWDIG